MANNYRARPGHDYDSVLESNNISVDHVKRWDNGEISFTVHIEVNDLIVDLHGIRIKDGRNGKFLSFPAYKANNGKFYKHCYADFPDEVTEAIIATAER